MNERLGLRVWLGRIGRLALMYRFSDMRGEITCALAPHNAVCAFDLSFGLPLIYPFGLPERAKETANHYLIDYGFA
jgi:hypothetical protein